MESSGPEADSSSLEVELRLLGPVRLSRAGVQVQLPPSRKVRALMAYLAVAPHPVSRERLCDLFWETPFDPRGELRWCLSKLRTLLDGPGRARVVAADERVWLDLDGCDVDVLRLLRAGAAGLAGLSDDELSALATLTVGDFLEGVETGASADFEHWLAARRNEFRSLRVDVVAEMGRRAPVGAPEGLAAALGWLELAPLDGRAHARFLAELFHRRMVDDCVRHLEAAEKAFAAEEVDFAPVREAWNRLRSASATAVPAVEPRREEHQPAAPRRASIAIMRSRSCVRGPPPAATSAMRSRMTSSAGWRGCAACSSSRAVRFRVAKKGYLQQIGERWAWTMWRRDISSGTGMPSSSGGGGRGETAHIVWTNGSRPARRAYRRARRHRRRHRFVYRAEIEMPSATARS